MGLPPPSSPSGLGLPPCYRAPQLQASTESADPTGTRGAPPSRSSSSPSSPSCSRPGPPVQKLSSRFPLIGGFGARTRPKKCDQSPLRSQDPPGLLHLCLLHQPHRDDVPH